MFDAATVDMLWQGTLETLYMTVATTVSVSYTHLTLPTTERV